MKIDHVHFYTRNAARTRDWFINHVGFEAVGNCICQNTHTELIVLNSAYLAISSPLNLDSPVADYFNHHPSGVADIAFRVTNLEAVIERVRGLGLKLLSKIQVGRSSQGNFKFAQILGWNDLRHTLIEAKGQLAHGLPLEIKPSVIDEVNASPDMRTTVGSARSASPLFLGRGTIHSRTPSLITNIDHVVLNVAQGELNSAVELYQALFQFKIQQSFQIQTNKSGLASQALIDDSASVQFNINEPTAANSQIQEFIDLNGGSGIQHLALRSPNLITDVTQMRQRGLAFLTVPSAYYQQLEQVLGLSKAEYQAIARQQILVDGDWAQPILRQAGLDSDSVQPRYSKSRGSNQTATQSLLMQIFTQPIFEQPTFFLEFIERRQEARGFGQGNFKALFEAVEREQTKRFTASDFPSF